MKKDCLARVMPHPSQTGKSEEGEEKSGEQRDLVLFSHSQIRLNLSERMFTNTPQVAPILRSLAADSVVRTDSLNLMVIFLQCILTRKTGSE